jgi:hypothetical protein
VIDLWTTGRHTVTLTKMKIIDVRNLYFLTTQEKERSSCKGYYSQVIEDNPSKNEIDKMSTPSEVWKRGKDMKENLSVRTRDGSRHSKR